jgi:indole-3-glycerol phosphate synthase
VVAESGIESKEGLMRVEPFADAALIGSLFMESDHPEDAWNELFK